MEGIMKAPAGTVQKTMVAKPDGFACAVEDTLPIHLLRAHTEESKAEAGKRVANLYLYQASGMGASKLFLGTQRDDTVSVRYRVGDRWHDWLPMPAWLRPYVVAYLARFAEFPAGPDPKEGLIEFPFGAVAMRWRLTVASEEGEWVLTRIEA